MTGTMQLTVQQVTETYGDAHERAELAAENLVLAVLRQAAVAEAQTLRLTEAEADALFRPALGEGPDDVVRRVSEAVARRIVDRRAPLALQ